MDDDERDPTDMGVSAPLPERELPPPIPGAAMSDDEIAERLRALGMHIEARDVARLDDAARAARVAWFERKRREEAK